MGDFDRYDHTVKENRVVFLIRFGDFSCCRYDSMIDGTIRFHLGCDSSIEMLSISLDH